MITAVMAVDDVKAAQTVAQAAVAGWRGGAGSSAEHHLAGWDNPGDPPGAIHYDQGAGVLANNVRNPFGGIIELPLFMAAFLTIFWIVGTTNAINWIDGLDGLAASVSAVACVVLFVVTGPVLGQWSLAYLPLILAAAIIGFLPYNIHPARSLHGRFGGDVPGVHAGGPVGDRGAKVAAALLVLGVPILDGVYMIIYRLSRGRSPLSADRGHLHHRLFDIGFSQGQVVLIYVGLCGTFGLIALLPDRFLGADPSNNLFRLLKLGGLVAMVVVLVAIFVYISRRQFDRRGNKMATVVDRDNGSSCQGSGVGTMDGRVKRKT